MIAVLALLAAVPAEIAAFAERYESCIHWVGEDPYDPDRAREIEREVKALACDRLDRDEAALRRRYKDRVDAIARLDALRAID